MSCAHCPELAKLTRECRELREELEEYRQRGGAITAESVSLERLDRLRQVFGITASRARMLMLLCERPGHIFSHDAIREALQSDSEHWGRSGGVAAVYACLVNRTFERAGRDRPITNHWGLGYSVAAETAAEILAHIDGGAE